MSPDELEVGDFIRIRDYWNDRAWRNVPTTNKEDIRVGLIIEIDEDKDPVIYLSSEVPRFYVYKNDVVAVISRGGDK